MIFSDVWPPSPKTFLKTYFAKVGVWKDRSTVSDLSQTDVFKYNSRSQTSSVLKVKFHQRFAHLRLIQNKSTVLSSWNKRWNLYLPFCSSLWLSTLSYQIRDVHQEHRTRLLIWMTQKIVRDSSRVLVAMLCRQTVHLVIFKTNNKLFVVW